MIRGLQTALGLFLLAFIVSRIALFYVKQFAPDVLIEEVLGISGWETPADIAKGTDRYPILSFLRHTHSAPAS